MASDLSSNCTDSISKYDEKEEGEISLEDVSSSEEGQPNYSVRRNNPGDRCEHCTSTNRCTSWCTFDKNYYKNQSKRDVAYGKENRLLSKESGYLGAKHTSSTLQEKNDDLEPISNDSDMEIVGLHPSTVNVAEAPLKSRKRKKKRKARNKRLITDDVTIIDNNLKSNLVNKDEHLSRLRLRDDDDDDDEDLSVPQAIPIKRLKVTETPSRRRNKPASSKMKTKRTPTATSCDNSKLLHTPKVRAQDYKQMTRCVNQSQVIRDSDENNYNYKLLKKVKRLDNYKAPRAVSHHSMKRNGSSLKDKINNMLNKTQEPINSQSRDKENVIKGNKSDTDDEDVARLRQIALETKQKKAAKSVENCAQNADASTEKTNVEEDDDEGEDLKLRLIALKSAIEKKYQQKNRELKCKVRRKTRSESPFDDSLLRNVDEIENDRKKSSSNPKDQQETNCLEDMDLDTDIEREKEKDDEDDCSPYSPSDNLNSRLSLERELLGIDPTDTCYLDNKSARPSSNYNDSSSPYCPSEPISNSCDFSPSSPTSSPDEMSETCDSYAGDAVASPAVGCHSSATSNYDESKNKVTTHEPLSPPPAPPQICTITNFLCASFVDDLIEKDLDGSPLVPIDEDFGITLARNDNQTPMNVDSSLGNSNAVTETNSLAKPLSQHEEATLQSNLDYLKRPSKKHRSSPNLKPVPMTSIPITAPTLSKDIPMVNAAVDADEDGERNRKHERAEEKSTEKNEEPTTKVMKIMEKKQSDAANQSSITKKLPRTADCEVNESSRKVSVDEDEETLREKLLASIGRSKTSDVQSSKQMSTKNATENENTEAKNVPKPTLPIVSSAKAPPSVVGQTVGQIRTVLPPSTKTFVVNKEASQIVRPQPSTSGSTKMNNQPVIVAKKKTTTVPSQAATRFANKKIVKRTTFPTHASTTKIVNQMKVAEKPPMPNINVPKMSVTFNAQNPTNTALRKVNVKDTVGPLSPTTDLSDFVIRLNSDSETDSDMEQQNTAPPVLPRVQRPVLNIPKSEFERSVDKFLREVRKKQEIAAAVGKANPPPQINVTPEKNKSLDNDALQSTPAAVRHLSASKQEEYRRLKQKIIEREKLKLQRAQNTVNQSVNTQIGGESKAKPNTTLTAKTTVQPKVENKPTNSAIIKQSESTINNSANQAKLDNTKQTATVKITSTNESLTSKNNIHKNESNVTLNKAEPSIEKQNNVTNIPSEDNTKSSTTGSDKNLATTTVKLSTVDENVINKNNEKSATESEKITPNKERTEVVHKEVDSLILPDASVSSPLLVEKSKVINENDSSNQVIKSTETVVHQKIETKTTEETVVQSKNLVDQCMAPVEKPTKDNSSTLNPPIASIKEKIVINSEESSEQILDKVIEDPVKPTAEIEIQRNVEVKKVALKILTIPELNSKLEHHKDEMCLEISSIAKEKSQSLSADVESTVVDLNDSIVILNDSSSNVNTDKPEQISNVHSNESTVSSNSNDNNNDNNKTSSGNNDDNSQLNLNSRIYDRKEVRQELQQISILSQAEQKEELQNIEKVLISLRNSFLVDLTKLEEIYKQWEIEKQEQQKLGSEIKELQNLLRLAEEKFQEQKKRLSNMSSSAATFHVKVNRGRDEYNKLSRICNGLGHRLHGSSYKIPASGAQLVSNKLKVVAAYSQKFSSSRGGGERQNVKDSTHRESNSVINPYAKRPRMQSETEVITINDIDMADSSVESHAKPKQSQKTGEQLVQNDNGPMRTSDDDRLSSNNTAVQDKHKHDSVADKCASTNNAPKPYVSILSHLKDSRNTSSDGILCPYELRGTCNDTECPFHHLHNR